MTLMAAAPGETGYRCLDAITRAVLDVWPDHERFLRMSFERTDHDLMSRIEQVAELSLALMEGDLNGFAASYRWMCEQFREEQFYFARHKRYRLSTVRQAQESVYDNGTYMSRYVKGILISQICWANHAKAMDLFRTRFLPANKAGYDHLEVGPGHGLFLVFAAQDPRCNSITGWDLSASSLASTRIALGKMKLNRTIRLAVQDIAQGDTPQEQFDSIMCSEVLEHTQEPERALHRMHASLRPGGRIFLNVPVNSPAPDHIYLWRKPGDVRDMIASNAFVVDGFIELSPTGKTLDQAKKHGFDISCIIIGHRS